MVISSVHAREPQGIFPTQQEFQNVESFAVFIQSRGGEGAVRVRYWTSCFWWMWPWNSFTLICRIYKCVLPCIPRVCSTSAFPWHFPTSALCPQCLFHSSSAFSEQSLFLLTPFRLQVSVLGLHLCTIYTFFQYYRELGKHQGGNIFCHNTNFLSLHSSKKATELSTLPA